MASGPRDANQVVVLMGVDSSTGVIRPLTIEHATGHLNMNIQAGPTSATPTLRSFSKHDENNVPTIMSVVQSTGDIAIPTIEHTSGYLNITVVP